MFFMLGATRPLCERTVVILIKVKVNVLKVEIHGIVLHIVLMYLYLLYTLLVTGEEDFVFGA